LVYLAKGHFTFLFIFFMALFYLIGILVANKFFGFRSKKKYFSNKIKINTKFNPSVLIFSLISMTFVSIIVDLYRFMTQGSSLFTRIFYSSTLISPSSSVTSELLQSIGIYGLLFVFLIAYISYKESKNYKENKKFKSISIVSFSFYVLFSLFSGAKIDAIFPFLYLMITFFYVNRKMNKKIFFVFAIIIFLALIFIGYFWTTHSNNFELNNVINLYYGRSTYWSTNLLDYMLYNYFPYYHYQYGNTVILELKRIISQITFSSRPPLFNNIVGNMMNGFPYFASLQVLTPTSPELTFFGMSYANFGILGASFGAILLGFFIQWLNIYLLSKKSINLLREVFFLFLVFNVLSFIRSGNLIISFEAYLIQIIPSFVLVLFFYEYFHLPLKRTDRQVSQILHFDLTKSKETKDN